MKRYRVWEANRKILLYPENWLDPATRDNKTPFFRDLESALLQSDVTPELAERAYLHYLEQLDEVAKLEISAAYYQYPEAGDLFEHPILHVFGRTTGMNRKYFYRRFDGRELVGLGKKIGAEIEDNPILPVIWKNRLILFWLTVIGKARHGTAVYGTGH